MGKFGERMVDRLRSALNVSFVVTKIKFNI